MIDAFIVQEFERIVGRDNVFSEESDLYVYSYDASVVEPKLPAIVVRPNCSEEVGDIVKICNDNGFPLIARGAGTNLSGGTIPSKENSVVVVTNGLNKILEINEEDMYAVVQPGVITANFAAAAEEKGLFYPPDPASQEVSTIGGNVAENAGGLRGLKYGVTLDYVMGLKFYNTSGQLVKTGSKTVKCATGYNLTGLMVGSEGTLGIFDEIILKLIPFPAHRKSMVAVFKHMNDAAESVAAIIANRIIPATLEIMDNFTIRAVEEYSHVGLPKDASGLLLIEMDGHPAEVKENAEKVQNICKEVGALSIQMARNDVERDKVWTARRNALSALSRLKPTLVLEDATVPRSKIPAMVQAIRNIGNIYKLKIGMFGHAGDGNLHPTILTDKRDKAEWERVEAAIEAIFDQALNLGGTLSGEHGIGIAKAKFLEKEIGLASIIFSRKIKKTLDPKNILNPGKFISD